MFLLYHELLHLIIGLVIGLLFYWRYKNWKLILLSFFVSMFLDADHYIDFLLANNFSNLNPFLVFFADYFQFSGKVYVLFHGWEYVILLLLLFVWFKSKRWALYLLVIALAMFGHLLLDQFTYPAVWFTYSVFGRFFYDFDLNRLFF